MSSGDDSDKGQSVLAGFGRALVSMTLSQCGEAQAETCRQGNPGGGQLTSVGRCCDVTTGALEGA